jgi:PKD repeat protein
MANQVTTGYQMLWRVTNESTGRMNNYVTPFDPSAVLQAAVDKGLAANARFLEIYQLDILNADLQGVLANAQSRTANFTPAATITGAPLSGHSPEGTSITLAGNVSDANAVDMASGFLYAWTVTKNGEAYASGSTAGFTFTPNDNGVYVATLIVTDRDGASSTPSSVTITVDNMAPLVVLSGPYAAKVGSALALTATVTDASLLDAGAGFSFLWDFGDGTTATGRTANHVYAQPGTYTVRLSVTDKDGSTGSVATSVVVS